MVCQNKPHLTTNISAWSSVDPTRFWQKMGSMVRHGKNCVLQTKTYTEKILILTVMHGGGSAMFFKSCFVFFLNQRPLEPCFNIMASWTSGYTRKFERKIWLPLPRGYNWDMGALLSIFQQFTGNPSTVKFTVNCCKTFSQ